jgi:uncharacterized protein (DUF1501 family)
MCRLARAEGASAFLVIVLRGALDWLAAVTRSAIPTGGGSRRQGGAQARLAGCCLDNFFALNPAMLNLHRLYKAEQQYRARRRHLSALAADGGCAGKRFPGRRVTTGGSTALSPRSNRPAAPANRAGAKPSRSGR